MPCVSPFRAAATLGSLAKLSLSAAFSRASSLPDMSWPDEKCFPFDFNTIPLIAIERIEILRDGAGAQYGSDAIAGVINIVLKVISPTWRILNTFY